MRHVCQYKRYPQASFYCHDLKAVTSHATSQPMKAKHAVPRKVFSMRIDDDFLKEVDRLRKLMSPTPSKSDVVRIAVSNELKRMEKVAK